MNQKQVIKYLKTYKWNQLWELVKNYDESLMDLSAYNEEFALKAFLLTVWWQEHYSAEQIISKLCLPTTTLEFFFHSMVWISLGNEKKYKQIKSKLPIKTDKWIKMWLNIEYSGRSQSMDTQLNFIKSITPKNSLMPSYAIIAFITSTQYKHVNYSYMTNWLKEIKYFELESHWDDLHRFLFYKLKLIDSKQIGMHGQATVFKELIDKSLIEKAIFYSDEKVKESFFNFSTIQSWLTLSISMSQTFESTISRINYALGKGINNIVYNGTLASFTLIYYWIKGDIENCYKVANSFIKFKDIKYHHNLIKIPIIFFNYIISLCITWQHNKNLYTNKGEPLTVIGESHALALSNISFKLNNSVYCGKTNFLMGIKMYHLVNPENNYFSKCFQNYIIESSNKNKSLFIAIGEIDTRPDEGIWKYSKENNTDIFGILDKTLKGYIDFLKSNINNSSFKSIIIQGIPAPRYNLSTNLQKKEISLFLNMIKEINHKLKKLVIKCNWNFLDVYSATVGDDGKSNKKWHLDGYHLSPVFYAVEADKWLIKPETNISNESKALVSDKIDFSQYKTVSLSKPTS